MNDNKLFEMPGYPSNLWLNLVQTIVLLGAVSVIETAKNEEDLKEGNDIMDEVIFACTKREIQ